MRLHPLVAGTLIAVLLSSCGSEDAPVTDEEYLASLETVCAETAAGLDALPEPPEQISVTDFANEAAALLEQEAEQVRRLDAPSERADDHRAFIRNTDEQAAAWTAVADDPDALVDVTGRIGQLVLGRNDLVDEMGAAACRRGAA